MHLRLQNDPAIPTGIYSTKKIRKIRQVNVDFDIMGVGVRFYKLLPEDIHGSTIPYTSKDSKLIVTANIADTSKYTQFLKLVEEKKTAIKKMIMDDKSTNFKTLYPKAQVFDFTETALSKFDWVNSYKNDLPYIEGHFNSVHLAGQTTTTITIPSQLHYLRVSVTDTSRKLKEYDIFDMFKESGIFYVSGHGDTRVTMYMADLDDYSIELMKIMGFKYKISIINSPIRGLANVDFSSVWGTLSTHPSFFV